MVLVNTDDFDDRINCVDNFDGEQIILLVILMMKSMVQTDVMVNLIITIDSSIIFTKSIDSSTLHSLVPLIPTLGSPTQLIPNDQIHQQY